MLGARRRENEEWPRPAAHTPESLAMASDPKVQAAISCYLGFGRTIPAEIIDAGAASEVYRITRDKTPEEAVALFKAKAGSLHLKALLRAVHHNLWLMRKDGRLPWEA